jgi:protein O-GlcNAc transferase
MSTSESPQHSSFATLDAACHKAMHLQLGGQPELAEQLYRSILGAEPSHAAASHCLGMLKVQLQRPVDGLPYLLAALNENPQIPDYWLGYLEALLLSDHLEDAKTALAVGRQYGLAGASVDDFTQRLEAKLPAQPAPLNVRRQTRDLRRHDIALQAAIKGGRTAEALGLAGAMTERFPEHGVGWKTLGALLWWEKRTDEALIPMQRAVHLMPKDAEAHSNLGMAWFKLKRIDDALASFTRALEIDRDFAAAHYHLGMTHLLQERYAEAEASLRHAVRLRPDYLTNDPLLYSDLLFLSSHNPTFGADDLFADHCRYGECFETPLRGSWPRHSNGTDPERCLKVGLVSGDLNDHAVGSFIEPVLAQLRQCQGLELYAYYNNVREDTVSARLQKLFKHWDPISTLSDGELATKITADGIDILIDLAGHTGLNRLRTFAHKPAPIQVSWLGYPGTTGLRGMDYYLADRHWLPPGDFDRQFTEQLVYLPDRWTFQPHSSAPAVNALPALQTGRLMFGSFNRVGKINLATLRLWSQLLRTLPDAKMLLGGMPSDGEHRIMSDQFAAEGIARERLQFHGRGTMDLYLALHHQVDICLDTQPYAGGTTTMHALSMGVPTLALAGSTPFARAGAGILAQLGITGFTATNAADFVAKGLYWASHLDELALVRSDMRTRMQQSPGAPAGFFAAQFELALRHMWRRWCANLPTEPFHSCALESST